MKRELTLTDMDGHTAVQTCKICGCTKDDPCDHEKLGMCWWVKADLCSHCAMIQAARTARMWRATKHGALPAARICRSSAR